MLFFWAVAAALAAIVVTAVVLVVVGGGDGHSGTGIDADTTPVVVTGDRAEVLVVDNAFNPAIVNVPAGATVAWRWDGNLPHNVRGADDAFESDTQIEGSFEFTFADAATYDYECTVHPGMEGRVVVGAP